MELFCRILGKGEPLIILHGLYGSSDNWLSVAKSLAEHYHVYVPDMRNHGKSDHSDQHNYDCMVDDIRELIDKHNLTSVNLLGHSMGGKVVMQLAINQPELFKRIIAVDISPFSYLTPEFRKNFLLHKGIMEALLKIDLSSINNLSDADAAFEPSMPDIRLRQFLLKNLNRKDDGNFQWKINLSVLYDNLENLLDNIKVEEKRKYHGPTLFIKGGMSNYLRKDILPDLQTLFPKARLCKIDMAGHWVHYERPDEFIPLVLDFLSNG